MNPAVPCIFPSILNISTVELQFYSSTINFQGGRKTAISAKCHWIQGLQSSSTQQNLHSKWQQGSPGSPCAVPHASKHSKWQQGSPGFPCAVPCASKHSTRQKLHSMQPEASSRSLWSSRVAVEEEF